MTANRLFFLIDDDTDDQELFLEAVREVDSTIECRSVSSCEEALHLLKNKLIAPDVIFLDLNMPRVSGKQCLAEIKREAHLKHIPVVIYTTSSEKRDIEEATRLGASHFLTKPNKFEELCKAVSSVVSKNWE